MKRSNSKWDWQELRLWYTFYKVSLFSKNPTNGQKEAVKIVDHALETLYWRYRAAYDDPRKVLLDYWRKMDAPDMDTAFVVAGGDRFINQLFPEKETK